MGTTVSDEVDQIVGVKLSARDIRASIKYEEEMHAILLRRLRAYERSLKSLRVRLAARGGR